MRFGLMGERLVGLFLLGVLLFNPPILNLFSVERLTAGIPLLYLYIFASWAAVIALAAFAIERTREPPTTERMPEPAPHGESEG
jgi:hypothetical protein